jgi:hypothetical protein
MSQSTRYGMGRQGGESVEELAESGQPYFLLVAKVDVQYGHPLLCHHQLLGYNTQRE